MEIKPKVKSCTILVTSDIHGHLFPTDYRSREEQQLGLAKVATLIQRERQKSPNLIFVDNGDFIQGTPLATYAMVNYPDQVHPAVAALNALQCDAAVIGNHEFNYGLERLHKAIQDSHFPWLSAGIKLASTQEPAFGKPYVIKWIDQQMKVAILGVTTHYIPNWEAGEHIAGLTFCDGLDTVKEMVAYLRKEEAPDLLIVAYHGGFERDLLSGEPVERLTGENQGYAMCTEVEGIDILITGHQHRLLAGEVNGVSIVQPGVNGQALGKITVTCHESNGRWEVVHKQVELIYPDEETPADPAILQLAQTTEEETQAWLDQPIGQVKGNMVIANPFECRLQAHPFMAFVHEVQMDAAGVQISNAALLSEKSQGFQSTITMRDVLTNFIYPNTLTVLRLEGRDIRAGLEQTAGYFQINDRGGLSVHPAYLIPKAQHYNYDMWGGIEYELDISKPYGQRVSFLTCKGQPVRDDTTYDVVMNNYRAGGGGDYEMYRGKPIVREVAIDMAELAVTYIRKHGTITAQNEANWRVVATAVD